MGEAQIAADRLLREGRVESPPVRLTKLIKAKGLTLEKKKLDPHVSSILLRGPKPRIVLNTRLDAEQRRFSTAHSLGHHLLHDGNAQAFVTDLTVHLCVEPPVQSDPREVEANTFAMELLMPEHLLRKDLSKGRRIDLSDSAGVGKLAARYRVTREILILRAVRLGLIWGG
ncbi:MAG: ImmA/IrrE family metallo-endopeptidase [Longimicrobiales bacterium]